MYMKPALETGGPEIDGIAVEKEAQQCETIERREQFGSSAFGEVAKMHGTITCMSDHTYKYFVQCFEWIPGGRAYWKAWLYAENNEFIFDDVRTSKDQLANFEGELLNMDIGTVLVKALADSELRAAIENWDSLREPE
jgi:hypothetical protein